MCKNKKIYSYSILIEKTLNLHESKIDPMNVILDNNYNLVLDTLFIILIGIKSCMHAIKSLEKDYNIIPGYILSRSIFEGLVNIKYILKDNKENRAAIFSLRDYDIKITFANNILKNFENGSPLSLKKPYNNIANTKKRISSIKAEKNKMIDALNSEYNLSLDKNNLESWCENMYDKSKDVGLFHDYRYIYKALCNYSHLDSTGLKQFYDKKDDKYELNIKKDKEQTEAMISGAVSYYFRALIDVLKEFNLFNESEFKPIKNIFKFLDKKHNVLNN